MARKDALAGVDGRDLLSKGAPLPENITVGGATLPFETIFDDFARSEWGQRLKASMRYERYNLGNLTLEEWENLLGPDVNNLEHLLLTLNMTREFLVSCADFVAAHPFQSPTTDVSVADPAKMYFHREEIDFTTDDAQRLLFAAVTHDFGEAITGDISYDQKMAGADAIEISAINAVLKGLYGEGANLDLLLFAQDVTDNVSFSRTTKLGRAFNAIERLGYLRTGLAARRLTALYAGDLAERLGRQDVHTFRRVKQGLDQLAQNVLLNQIPTLVQYSEVYPPVADFLRQEAAEITDAFQRYGEISEAILQLYKEDERENYRQKFNAAKEAWEIHLERAMPQLLTEFAASNTIS